LGGEISLNKDIQQTLLNNYGVFTFNANSTARVAGGGVTAAAGNAFADFLIGIPSAVSQDAPVTGYTNTWYTALFVQDDFKAHPRVTPQSWSALGCADGAYGSSKPGRQL
jgi:hypothetical protein